MILANETYDMTLLIDPDVWAVLVIGGCVWAIVMLVMFMGRTSRKRKR